MITPQAEATTRQPTSAVDIALEHSHRWVESLSSEFEAGTDHQTRYDLLEDNLKFLAELAILIDIAGSDSKVATACAEGCARLLLSPAAGFFSLVNPRNLPIPLNLIATLADRLTNFAQHRETMLELVALYGACAFTMPSYRQDEIAYVLARLSDRPSPSVDYEPYLNNAPYLDRDQTYALTHLLFYATDYGNRQGEIMASADPALSYLLFDAYERRDLDCFVELLICYRCVDGVGPLQLSRFIPLLAKLFRGDPHFLKTAPPTHDEFKTRYHEWFVLAILEARTGLTPAAVLTAQHDVSQSLALRRFWAFCRRLGSTNSVELAKAYAAVRTGSSHLAEAADQYFRRYCRTVELLGLAPVMDEQITEAI